MAVAALLLVCVFHRWYGFDIWYHLALGREVVRTGSPNATGTVLLHQPEYRNIYWLFQVVVWSVYSMSGTAAVTALIAAWWLLAFTFWAKTADAFSCPAAGVPLTAVAIVACQLRFEERPEVLSYFFVALHIWMIRQLAEGTLTPRNIAVWLGSQVVWANVHGYFALGLAILLFWLCISWKEQPRSRLLTGWKIAIGLAAATLVNPFGVGAWISVIDFARYFSTMKRAVIEFRPYPLSGYGWTIGFFWVWFAIVAILALSDLALRRKIYQPVLALGGVALGAISARNAPLAVLLSGPLLAQHIPSYGDWLTRRAPRMLLPTAIAVLSLTYVGHVFATGSYAPLVTYDYTPGTALAHDDYPVSAAEYLQKSGFSGSIFVHPSDGSYLEYTTPSARPYADTRFIDVEATTEYFEALRELSAFKKLHERQHFDAVLINIRENQTELVSLLADRRSWWLVYADAYRGVIANRMSTGAGALEQGRLRFYSGQSFERPADYNAAGSWLQGFAEAGRTDLFVLALRQMGSSRDFPQDLRKAAQAYAAKVGSPEIWRAAAAP